MNLKRFPDYMVYKGRVILDYREVSESELNSAKEDAERVLGLRPAPYRDPLEAYKARMDGESEYLEPPLEGSSLYQWATGLLKVRPPAIEIWVGRGLAIVGLNGLTKLERGAEDAANSG